MIPVSILPLLAVLAGTAQHTNYKHSGLVQASPYQDAAHYALPPNIYNNIPAGLTTPISFRTYPTPTSASASPVKQRDIPSSPAGTEGPTGFDITAPQLNSIYTPGSGLTMAWSNREVAFPDSWVAPQSIMDLITQDANFSNSPLLTKEDIRNLAKIKVQDLRASQQANAIKDSPVLLKSLRLLSWPLSKSDESATTTTTTIGLSANILSDPGFNFFNSVNNNSARLTILGSSGGVLLWTIPADWEYEGEFEIEISTAEGTPGRHTSRSFWILRDAVTRQLNPQYNLPSMDQQQQSLLESKSAAWTKADIHRQKNMGVFLGVAAMMSAFVLVGLGFLVGMYRRKWAAQDTAACAGSGSLPSSRRSSSNLESAATAMACCTAPSDDGIKQTLSTPTTARNWYSAYTSSSAGILTKKQQRQSLLDPIQGDEDAHSSKDLNLNLSEETLRGVTVKDDNDDDEKKVGAESGFIAVGGGGGSASTTLVDESFVDVDLPLYDSGHNDGASTLANEKRS
ncbi:hypothetical protein BG015_011177 [Linnemannia schmuckeri]|uniref:Uncharacterized protein n=1 Tax=Linnemannia schmuckeri TaxID=64567 RepID=A0A9P5RT35_9FUNG|nr:hypothetical protein BG015_011177 [Linnemannia schmuckeri]